MLSQHNSFYLAVGWEPASRIERITELLAGTTKVDTDFFAMMQNDVVSKHAQYVLPRLMQLLNDTTAEATTARAANDTVLSDLERKALLLLADWDYVEGAESVPAAIFNVWAWEFLQATIKDELGDTLFQAYTQWSTLAVRSLEHFVAHPASAWFDDRRSEAREDGRYIAQQSLRQALAFLQERFGDLIGDWQWGRLHQLTLSHVFSERKPLQYIFDAGPFPMSGSPNTINKAEYSFYTPYNSKVGPSVRMIVDMASPDTRMQVLAGGQSGQPFSEHYKDQVELWRKGRYKRVLMNRETLAQTCKEVLLLQSAEGTN